MNIEIRLAEVYDIPELAKLYETTVLEIAPQKYTIVNAQLEIVEKLI